MGWFFLSVPNVLLHPIVDPVFIHLLMFCGVPLSNPPFLNLHFAPFFLVKPVLFGARWDPPVIPGTIRQARGGRDQHVHVRRPALQGALGGAVEATPTVALHRGGQAEEEKRLLGWTDHWCQNGNVIIRIS